MGAGRRAPCGAPCVHFVGAGSVLPSIESRAGLPAPCCAWASARRLSVLSHCAPQGSKPQTNSAKRFGKWAPSLPKRRSGGDLPSTIVSADWVSLSTYCLMSSPQFHADMSMRPSGAAMNPSTVIWACSLSFLMSSIPGVDQTRFKERCVARHQRRSHWDPRVRSAGHPTAHPSGVRRPVPPSLKVAGTHLQHLRLR